MPCQDRQWRCAHLAQQRAAVQAAHAIQLSQLPNREAQAPCERDAGAHKFEVKKLDALQQKASRTDAQAQW